MYLFALWHQIVVKLPEMLFIARMPTFPSNFSHVEAVDGKAKCFSDSSSLCYNVLYSSVFIVMPRGKQTLKLNLKKPITYQDRGIETSPEKYYLFTNLKTLITQIKRIPEFKN